MRASYVLLLYTNKIKKSQKYLISPYTIKLLIKYCSTFIKSNNNILKQPAAPSIIKLVVKKRQQYITECTISACNVALHPQIQTIKYSKNSTQPRALQKYLWPHYNSTAQSVLLALATGSYMIKIPMTTLQQYSIKCAISACIVAVHS